MTYFGFLLRFLVIPIVILIGLTLWDKRQGRKLPPTLTLLPAWVLVLALVILAVVYTTPWDNYLVATGVWWYDPALVTGITFGWVPLEEYTFFVLESLLVSLWLLWLARRWPPTQPFVPRPALRIGAVVIGGVLWVFSLVILLAGWKPGTYLGLELVWALPPIMLQLAVGADILWHYRRIVFTVLFSAVLYLCLTDFLAIDSGTWTISPEQSLNILIGGVLPLEEVIFFTLTVVLLVLGLVLGLAWETATRIPARLRLPKSESA